MGKKNFSFCKSCFRSLQLEEAHANEINHDIHLANTLFQIKVRQKKNMAAVCGGISLFICTTAIHLSVSMCGLDIDTSFFKAFVYINSDCQLVIRATHDIVNLQTKCCFWPLATV